MSLCLGVDLSTKRVDLAAIPLDLDITFEPRHWRINVEDRYAWLRAQVSWSVLMLEEDTGYDVVTIAVEKPAGRHVHPSLHEIYGVVRSAVRTELPTTGLYPVEWRQALGLTGRDKNNKAAGLARVLELYPSCATWDEHQLDALGIAHAWRTIQWNATAA